MLVFMPGMLSTGNVFNGSWQVVAGGTP